MKAITILSTCTLFSSTQTWAKYLEASQNITENSSAIEENKSTISTDNSTISQIPDEPIEPDVPDENSNTCIDDYYSETGEYCGKWVGATLRKLPVWGQVGSYYDPQLVDFEWPTEAQFAEMSPNVSLKSIDLRTHCPDPLCPWVEAAQVKLSDESQSPMFGYDALGSYAEMTFDTEPRYWWSESTYDVPNFDPFIFDSERPIRQVKAAELWVAEDEYMIVRMKFLDQEGEQIYDYNPQNMPNDDFKTYDIAENEEIIGIYGTMIVHWNSIGTLGFIVKTAQ